MALSASTEAPLKRIALFAFAPTEIHRQEDGTPLMNAGMLRA
jgi:hypothetical protein